MLSSIRCIQYTQSKSKCPVPVFTLGLPIRVQQFIHNGDCMDGNVLAFLASFVAVPKSKDRWVFGLTPSAGPEVDYGNAKTRNKKPCVATTRRLNRTNDDDHPEAIGFSKSGASGGCDGAASRPLARSAVLRNNIEAVVDGAGAKGEDMFRKTHFKIRHIRLNLYDSAAGCGCEAGEQSRIAGCRLV